MLLFNLNPEKSAKELFGRESELDEPVHLIKARRWVAVLGSRISSSDLPSVTLSGSVLSNSIRGTRMT